MFLEPQGDLRRAPVTMVLMALCVTIEMGLFLGGLFSPVGDLGVRTAAYNDFKLGIWLQMWRGEYWRPFTTTLLHANFLHMAFNVHCLWTFGPAIESWLGSFRFAGLVVLLAYVSSLAEFTLWPILGPWLMPDPPDIQGLVGFSGVDFGLFGFCWMAREHRSECSLVCPDAIIQWMMSWFLIFIAFSALKWMPVANIAHGAGLGLGMLLGMATVEQGRRAIPWIVASTVVSLLFLSTMFYCPWHPLWRWVAHR